MIVILILLIIIGFSMSSGSHGNSKLVLMRIIGGISVSSDSYLSSNKFQKWMANLEKIEKSKSIKAVVIRIDSPGGTPAASQEVYNAILRVKKSGKKVIISMGDICASGGYYIASAGDKIFANPSTLTGSIGVIMSYPVINKLEETLGLKMVTIKSDKFKDVGSIHREPTIEEKTLLNELVLETYNQFIKDVALGRGMSTGEVKLLATGQLYTGSKAAKYGLVDEIGGLREAIETARILAELDKNEKIVKIGEEDGFLNSLFKVTANELKGIFLSKMNIKLKL